MCWERNILQCSARASWGLENKFIAKQQPSSEWPEIEPLFTYLTLVVRTPVRLKENEMIKCPAICLRYYCNFCGGVRASWSPFSVACTPSLTVIQGVIVFPTPAFPFVPSRHLNPYQLIYSPADSAVFSFGYISLKCPAEAFCVRRNLLTILWATFLPVSPPRVTTIGAPWCNSSCIYYWQQQQQRRRQQ